MYITTGASRRYAVTGQWIGPGEVRYQLAEAPAKLRETVKLWTADGSMCLRTDAVADWRYPRISGSAVILSNAPEPAEDLPAEDLPPEPVETVEEDLLAVALDHEARLAALELLGGGDI